MAGIRKFLIASSFAGALSLSLILATGCNNGLDGGSASAPASSPNSSGGPSRGPGGPGGDGTRRRRARRWRICGGPVAADASGSEILQKKCGCHGPGGKGGRAPVLHGWRGQMGRRAF